MSKRFIFKSIDKNVIQTNHKSFKSDSENVAYMLSFLVNDKFEHHDLTVASYEPKNLEERVILL